MLFYQCVGKVISLKLYCCYLINYIFIKNKKKYDIQNTNITNKYQKIKRYLHYNYKHNTKWKNVTKP
jgi:hypothetical protein